MDPKSVTKAKTRLNLAVAQLQAAKIAPSYGQFSDAWYLFLVSLKGTYNCLEQGSKTTAQSRQWFGGVKALRKRDELLQYLLQARNDDEHGIEEVTRLEPGHITLGKNAPGYSQAVELRNIVIIDGKLINAESHSMDGLPVLNEVQEPRIYLKPVTAKDKKVFQTPTTHLGKPLESDGPIYVGQLGIDCLKGLVDHATGLAS